MQQQRKQSMVLSNIQSVESSYLVYCFRIYLKLEVVIFYNIFQIQTKWFSGSNVVY